MSYLLLSLDKTAEPLINSWIRFETKEDVQAYFADEQMDPSDVGQLLEEGSLYLDKRDIMQLIEVPETPGEWIVTG